MNKKIYYILLAVFILFSTKVFSQENLIYDKIELAKANKKEFLEIPDAFIQVINDKDAFQQFEKPEEIESFFYKENVFNNLSEAVTLIIPSKRGEIQLELLEVSDLFYSYEVVTSDGLRKSSSNDLRHYRGIIKGDSSSVVAISFMKDEVIGLLATDEGNYNITLI